MGAQVSMPALTPPSPESVGLGGSITIHEINVPVAVTLAGIGDSPYQAGVDLGDGVVAAIDRGLGGRLRRVRRSQGDNVQ